MPRGRKKFTNPKTRSGQLERLTFRLDEETVNSFKQIAKAKKMSVEGLGREAISDLFQKHKPQMKKIFSKL